MGLLDTVVGIADRVTANLGLQATITHEAIRLPIAGNGKREYWPPVSRGVIAVKKQQLVRTTTGEMVMSQAYITFLSPVPINVLDRITLPDGTTGPILNTEGFVTTTNPILTEVYLG